MHKYLLQSFLFASPLLPAVKIGTNESSISCLFLPPLSLFLPLPLTLFQKKEGVPNGGEEEEEEGFFWKLSGGVKKYVLVPWNLDVTMLLVSAGKKKHR